MPEKRTFVYVSHHIGREIFVLQLKLESGTLVPIQQISVTGAAKPLAVSPDRRFLYVALRSEPYSVASFAINGLSGELTHLADAPMPDSMSYISTDRTGRFLFATSIPNMSPNGSSHFVNTSSATQRNGEISSVISISPIGPHGFVQPPHQIIRTEPKAHCILPDPSNRYVLVSCCDADLIRRETFDVSTGMCSYNALTPVRLKPKSGPRHFIFHPNNRFFYVLSEPDASIYAFRYDVTSGALTEIQIVSALPPDFGDKQPHAADLDLTPDGRFLYASERISSTLAAFKVDLASGMLTPAGTFPTEKRPHSFHIDPYGRYLLVAGELSNSMTSYAISHETGSLTKVKEFPLGKGPNCVRVVSLP